MTRNFSFDNVKRYLENKSAATSILDGFSTFADVATIFTPIVFGPQFLVLLEVLDIKDRLVDAGKKVLKFVESQTAPDYKERMCQIDSAYVILTLTSFVEALKEKLPSEDVKAVLEFLKKSEHFDFPTHGDEKGNFEKNKSLNIVFPNEVDLLSDVKSSLIQLYKDTCENMIEHFGKISNKISENDTNSKQSKKTIKSIKNIIGVLQHIPERAVVIYTAQLVDLMSSFDDFAAYVQLKEFKALKEGISDVMEFKSSYDVGFKSLSALIKSIHRSQKEEEVEKICEDLKKHYIGEINKPIAGNSENNSDELTGGVSLGDEHIDLNFPSVFDAYIPQAYKCLRYVNSISLENSSVWNNLPTKQDIGDFFVNYLSLPQSVEYPLVVLGLPGSGKSILTKVLSAQLMGSAYTVVRIPLRDIDASNDIHVIISEQISKCIQRPLKDGYAGFAEHFVNNPLLIIFDGYDELLQVKGDMFNGYISKIHEFQREQNGLGRPVRVMVTSRIALIDKVKIPKNSVIVNLEAFDQQRRNAWIKIWNDHNYEYFKRNDIKPFSLKDEKKLSKNVRELAEQPLLLLMLALFDSDSNALENIGDDMSRTHLYDELLRRICRREGNKLYTRNQREDIDEFVKKYVEGEMDRLGVVAIGMFNRKQLHIHTKDLLSDLLTYKVLNEWGETPKEADNLIRSFFFVHKSAADNENDAKKEYAYEFLHNTFGEFLTADFILNYLVRETGELFVAQNNKLQGNIVHKKLYDPNGLGYEWFVNLMFAPLYSRPLVVEMLREHLPCVLDRYELSKKDFQECLIELVETQLKLFLEGKNLPDILRDLDGFKDINLPLIGRIATYTLNITILASLLSDDGFTFDDRNYKSDTSQDSENCPWIKLTSLWKTWFSSDSLTGLSRMIKSNSEEIVVDNQKKTVVKLNCPALMDKVESGLNKIEQQLSVANAFSDKIEFSLYGLQTTRFADITKKNTEEILSILRTVNHNLYVKYIINLIRKETIKAPYKDDFNEINRLIKLVLQMDSLNELSQDVIIEYMSVIENAIYNHLVYIEVQIEILRFINAISRHCGDAEESLGVYSKIIVQLYKNLEEFIDIDENIYFRKEISYLLHNSIGGSYRLPYFNKNEIFLKNDRYNLYYNMKSKYDSIFLFLNENNISEYMRTAPQMVSHYLLYASQQMNCTNKKVQRLIKCYFEFVFEYKYNLGFEEYGYIEHVGRTRNMHPSCVGIRTMMYAIQIAKSINSNIYLNKCSKCIVEMIDISPSRRYYSNLIYTSPEILVIMFEHVPEILDDIKFLFAEKYICSNDIHFAISIIKLIKNSDLRIRGVKSEFDRTIFKIVSTILNEFIDRNENICDVLTINEYNDLLWYLEINESQFGKRIIKKIKQ